VNSGGQAGATRESKAAARKTGPGDKISVPAMRAPRAYSAQVQRCGMMMIPYPDVTSLPDDLGLAVCRMVRLVNEMRRRHPDLDRVAISTETPLDRRAAELVARYIERTVPDFQMMLSPWDGRQFMADGQGFGPLPTPGADRGTTES